MTPFNFSTAIDSEDDVSPLTNAVNDVKASTKGIKEMSFSSLPTAMMHQIEGSLIGEKTPLENPSFKQSVPPQSFHPYAPTLSNINYPQPTFDRKHGIQRVSSNDDESDIWEKLQLFKTFDEDTDTDTDNVVDDFTTHSHQDNAGDDFTTHSHQDINNNDGDEILVPHRSIPLVNQLVQETMELDNKIMTHKKESMRPASRKPDNVGDKRNLLQDLDLEREPSDDLMLGNYYDRKVAVRGNAAQRGYVTGFHGYNTTASPKNMKFDLEDPDNSEEQDLNKRPNEYFAGTVTPFLKQDIRSNFKTFRNKPQIVNMNVSPLVQSYYNIRGENLTEVTAMMHRNKTNANPIKFYPLKNVNRNVVCMDGTKPGYFERKGVDEGANKWIVHLHGGAWCYDFRSCLKRRDTILGSTAKWYRENIDSFFHGILSNNYFVNPHFFNWNTIVLSYCDGGLFSGNRKRPITGKEGKKFHFRGRAILKSQIEQLKRVGLQNATRVVLSGTSAGGLALILQGDFIRSHIPKHIKVRGLVDAGLFLDQPSANGRRYARKQFKALYKLQKPKLNKACERHFPPSERFMCMFPEHSLKFVKLPLFFVNSLYDHWQISELQQVKCVYNEVCPVEGRDNILNFRNAMYNTIKNVSQDKNNSGIFANSCFAHGQVILDYTWTKVQVGNRTISNAFNDWYNDDQFRSHHVNTDCRYPCNGSCPKMIAQRCVRNFKGASEHVRKRRNSELC